MFFGFRLPGPFRVGISSKGRVNVGASFGPFSVSGNVGGGRAVGGRPFHPIGLDAGLAELERIGWRVSYRDRRTAIVEKGWKARRIDVVPGGVTWDRHTRRRTVVFWVVVVPVVLLLLGFLLD